ERIDDPPGVESESCADPGRCAHHAENGCGMKSSLMNGLWYHGAQATHHFRADRNAQKGGGAVRLVPLASRQHCRHDHGTGMNRPAFEGVVEVLAMGRGAVDKGRAAGAESTRMAYGGARPFIIATGDSGPDVILVTSGDAETSDVY